MTRAARIEDCARIGEIHVEGWRAAYRGIMPDSLLAGLSYEKRAGGWRIAIERDPGSVVVIEDKGIIFGWAAIGRCREVIQGAGEVFAVYVEPSSWRKGFGMNLMKAAE